MMAVRLLKGDVKASLIIALIAGMKRFADLLFDNFVHDLSLPPAVIGEHWTVRYLTERGSGCQGVLLALIPI
jgi:hypothetical protein